QKSAGPFHIRVHLLDERIDGVELLLGTEVRRELDLARGTVQVAVEVEDVDLAQRSVVVLERRPDADVDRPGQTPAVPDPPPPVDTESGETRARMGLDVRRGE